MSPSGSLGGPVPEPLTHPRWESALASPVQLYRGPVDHRWQEVPVRGEGQVWLGWLPSPRVFISWGFDHTSELESIYTLNTLEITLPGVGAGRTHLGGSPDPPEGRTPASRAVRLSGAVDRFIAGVDKPIGDVRFLVINGPELLGSSLNDQRGFWRGRVVLDAHPWRFTLDQRRGMHDIKHQLKWSFPFGFTHVGRIERRDGAGIDVAEAAEALSLLGFLLSFIRGAAVAPVLPCGLDEQGAVVWEDWGSINRIVDPWRGTISWFDPSLTEHLGTLSDGFASRWTNPDDQQVLRFGIGLYLSSNDPRPLQTALTLAVAGLELFAWVYLVRDGEMDAADFDDQGARPRTLHGLLNQIGVPTDRTPTELPTLRKGGELGPHAIWKLRSRFSHPRIGTTDVDRELLGEAWRLATWYLEMTLLHWLEYTGPYGSRLIPGRWEGDTGPVPWVPAT
jgi:hypothetical protein